MKAHIQALLKVLMEEKQSDPGLSLFQLAAA